MHAVGLHSALAIKRQRKRRDEQKKARDRRFSSQSTESGLGESRSSVASPRNSIGSLDRKRSKRRRKVRKVKPEKVVSSVGMLHIGVVFLMLGLFLIGSGLMPDDFDHWDYKNYKWFNELVMSGIASVLLGAFLIILNKIIMKKEEDDLQKYVERQLTRSKSGHRLVRDSETGCLTTKVSSMSKTKTEDSMHIESEMNGGPISHFSPTIKSPPPLSASTPRSDLERILEEEGSEKIDIEMDFSHKDRNKDSAHDSGYTPGSETKELLNPRYYNSMEVYDD